ncbi:hypothetical protein QYE76_020586 [Lolium multiflorum]|uniref:Powdery mildew resistance protein 12-like n=1 Tax=Lolium multiflorum TaxID=4521 RepID=A0AAD8R815_LOLMU|nr:hypothetical protein QYE76_020586 [Lolium multiflorum]
MMPNPIVSATMGVMNPLLGKLAALLGDEYKKLKGVRKQASFLMRELSSMKAALEKLELMDELDPLAKNWRDHVREMSYDMENCIDDFMSQFGGADANAGLVKKTAQRLKTLRERHRIGHRMEELKVLALEANERRMRYKIDDCADSSPRVVPVDPRISAIYKDAAGLVGMDGPTEELVSRLVDIEKKIKVISIVGFGGLGKTTLAKQVYNKIGGQFDRKAFVSVSQKPEITSFLRGLQLKLGMEESSSVCEVQDIIDRLRKHLMSKRYLIVVDDLWDQSAWNIISCAFPEDGYRDMVVDLTTVGHLFQLRYLKVSAASASIELPTEIHRLVHLETLDIDGPSAQSIPSDITMLRRLSHLILPHDTGLPNGIGNMKSLHTLRCYCMGKSSLEDIEGLGELTNLRELTLTKSYKFDMVKSGVDALVTSIGKLRDLKSLYLACNLEHYVDLLDSLSEPPLRMEKLRLRRWPFYKVPKWIGDLDCLHTLFLCIEQLSTDDIHVLGKLPSLVYLSLKVLCIPRERVAIICGGGLFPVLECLALRSRDDDVTACMEFKAGAMPKLRKLVLGIHDRWGGSAMPVGMVCLLSLDQIYVDNMSSVHDDRDLESTFRNAAQLAVLVGDEYKKLTGVRRQASFLKDELSTMKALLEKLELMDDLDPLAKNWRDHVREMSYDMENCIDDFIHDLGGNDVKAGSSRRRLNIDVTEATKRHRIADRMEELKLLAI